MGEPGETASAVEWRAWGRSDPLFGVSSNAGREKGKPNAWTDAEFYEAGADAWNAYSRMWRRFGVTFGIVLEIGCGAGRVTGPLATNFRQVHAVDISPDMIEYARARIDATNIEYYVSNGLRLPVDNVSVDAVFSTHVFQHMDSVAEIARNVAEVGRITVPGGSLFIQLPLHEPHPGYGRLPEMMWTIRRGLGAFRNRILRALIKRGAAEPIMRLTYFGFSDLARVLATAGFEDVTFAYADPGQYPFVWARKAAI